jgi:hypothetical protein
LICEIERAFGTLCWAQKLFVVHGGDLCNGDAALQHAALSCNVQHLNQPVTTCRVAEAVPHAHCGDLCDGNAPCFASVCFGPARRPLDDLGAPVHFLTHAPRPAGQLASATPGHIAPGLGSPLPHPHRDWAHPSHIRTGTGLTPPTSAPGLGSPLPHPHRDWAHPSHIRTGTGLTPSTSHRDWAGTPCQAATRRCAHARRCEHRRSVCAGVGYAETPPARRAEQRGGGRRDVHRVLALGRTHCDDRHGRGSYDSCVALAGPRYII